MFDGYQADKYIEIAKRHLNDEEVELYKKILLEIAEIRASPARSSEELIATIFRLADIRNEAMFRRGAALSKEAQEAMTSVVAMLIHVGEHSDNGARLMHAVKEYSGSRDKLKASMKKMQDALRISQ